METDDDLLSRSVQEPSAFEPLVVRHSAALHGYLARRAPGAADDLLSEVWLQAFTGRAGYDADRGTPRTWLFGVARNVLSAHWRKREQDGRQLPGEQPRMCGWSVRSGTASDARAPPCRWT